MEDLSDPEDLDSNIDEMEDLDDVSSTSEAPPVCGSFSVILLFLYFVVNNEKYEVTGFNFWQVVLIFEVSLQ